MESRPPSIGACGDVEDDIKVGNAKDEDDDDEDGRWPEGEIVRRGASVVGGRFRWALWV